jgi:ABC-type transporter Mla maintaining outer membrane lipid asymmetry ATPase subunit MlaF
MADMQRSDHPWVKAYFRGRRATVLEQRHAMAPA